MRFGKVTLIGVGLLGGSLGLALRRQRLARNIVGFVRREASVAECRRFGVADDVTMDLQAAVRGADLLVFCTPLGQMRPLALQMVSALKPGAVVTDVGSVKGSVVRGLERVFQKAGAHFVGSHPMAGSEKTGPSAARPDLFARALCIVTPTPRSDPKAVRTIASLWRAVGARVMSLPPGAHDRYVSRTSHLPHVVAAQLAALVLDSRSPNAQAGICATGFRDTTRIASSSPVMWRDIAVANRKELSAALKAYIRRLEQVRSWIKRGDSEKVEAFFSQAKQRRDAWCEQMASESME